MVEYLNLALREQGITLAIGRFGNGCSSVWMFCILAGLAQPLGRSACCGMRSQVQILPAIHQSEQRKLKMCELERDISELDSLRTQLAKANERVNNIINGDMTPEDYHKISGSKFVIEKKLKALDDLLEEIQCSVVVPRRYEQFQEPYLEGIKHCIQFIECQQEQLRKEQE